MDGISNPRNIVDAIKLSINTASALYEYASDAKNAKSDMKDLSGEIKVHLSILTKAKDLLESQSGRLQVSQELRPALDTNYSELESIKLQLDKELGDKSSVRKRVSNRLRWSSQKHKITYDIEKLRKSRENIWSALNIDSANTIMDIHAILSDEILSKLSVVQGASFDSHANEHEPRCHPLTRVKILGEIEKWAQEPEGRRIYWLCGMAGTGKSTICRTVAHHLTNLNIVTASFFFKKGDNDRDKSSALFTTIVKQLVEHLPTEMASNVKKALQENPSIGDKMLSKQFEKLILEPLQSCKSLPPVIVVVLDALDECEDQASAARIIELLPSIENLSSTCFKVLVASRPECHLRTSFARLECKYYEIFLYEALHEVADEDIRKDISVFLEFQLGQVRDSYNLTNLQLPANWPSKSLVKAFVDISAPLFIVAATACRFIGDIDLGAPTALAQEFLQHHRQHGKTNHLARTYLPILEQLLVKRNGTVPEDRSKAEKERIIRDFRRVVGTIVLLEAPLSVTSLSKLLEMDTREVSLRLSGLNSVLNVPKDFNTPVKLFHLSFRDFLVGTGDQDQCHDFLVNEQEIHANIARQCIVLLSRDENLKQDICGLNHPGKLRSNIDQGVIDTCLPLHVRYACLHWVFHLKESRGHIRFDDETHRFLTKYLIHWLEALSLLDRIVESGDMVESLLAMVDDTDRVFGLLRDTKRFIRAYQHVLDVAPLQIYSSALIFAPKKCEFRQCFEEAIPKWIKHQPIAPMDWDLCLQTLEGHNERIYEAVLSPDSSLIASRGEHKVLIWKSQTGACTHEIDVCAKTMAFSRDSKLFYLVSSDFEVATWETNTWTCKTITKMDSTAPRDKKVHVNAAAISHDCKLVAVAFDTVIEIRSIITPNVLVKSFKIKQSSFSKIYFSPDSAYIAALFYDPTSLVAWPILSGEPTEIRDCLSAAYSPDSSLTAVYCGRAIEIYRNNKGPLNLHQKITLDYGYIVRSLAFSHDAALLAITTDEDVGIWLTDTGECIWKANDHTADITSLLFSHDSKFLVSSSADSTLRIYSVNKHRSLKVHKKKHERVEQITISPDSSFILLEPDCNNSVWQILRVNSGVCVGEFDRCILQSEPTFTHDSALALIRDDAAEIWHPDGYRSVQNLDGLCSNPSRVQVACFSADFALAAVILDDKSLQIWQTSTGECKHIVKFAVSGGYHPDTLCFSPDASRIACSSMFEKEVFVWQVGSDLSAQKFELSESVGFFALSNTKIAAAAPNDGFKIWNLKTGDFLKYFDLLHITNRGGVGRFSFSCDSKLLALAMSDVSETILYIWNADTGIRLRAIKVKLVITQLCFESNNDSVLRTNLGRTKFKDSSALCEDADGVGQLQPWYYEKLGYTSSSDKHNDGSWITFNGEKLLWLPANYRGAWSHSRAVSESVVAIVSKFSDLDIIIGFDLEKIPSWYHNSHKYFYYRSYKEKPTRGRRKNKGDRDSSIISWTS